jgi:phosphatidate phosphatase APP1
METEGDVFIQPSDCRFVVISDIDDTVMHTGVANKIMMMWRLFAEGAESRVAFPDMAALLNALHRGPNDSDSNPMLYVSRAPWSISSVLDSFFNMHSISGRSDPVSA